MAGENATSWGSRPLHHHSMGLSSSVGIVASLARIQATRLVRAPLGLSAWGLLAILVPVLVRLTPLGVIATQDPASELALRWALPVALVGAWVGLVTLGNLEGFLRWIPPGPRVSGELAVVLSAAVVLELPLFLGAWAARGPAPSAWSPQVFALGILGGLQLGLLAVLVTRLPAGAGSRAGVFLFLVWIAPVLVTDGGGSRGWGVPLLDLTFPLRSFAHLADAPGRALAGLAPIVALWGGNWLLLRSPGSPRP